MTDNILNNNLVDMVLAHNVGGPTGFDAISNDQSINFEKHAEIICMLFMKAYAYQLCILYSHKLLELEKCNFK